MKTNSPLFVTKVKNGFFVYPGDVEIDDGLSQGMVFTDFFDLVSFLNQHYQNISDVRVMERNADLVG